jgi:hypothetical protein
VHYSRFIIAACLTCVLLPAAHARPAPDTAGTTLGLAHVALWESTTAREAADPGSQPRLLANSLNVPVWGAPLTKPDGKKDKHHKRGHRHRHPGDPDNSGWEETAPLPNPEPGTLLLVGAAAGAVGLRRRLRARHR